MVTIYDLVKFVMIASMIIMVCVAYSDLMQKSRTANLIVMNILMRLPGNKVWMVNGRILRITKGDDYDNVLWDCNDIKKGGF